MAETQSSHGNESSPPGGKAEGVFSPSGLTEVTPYTVHLQPRIIYRIPFLNKIPGISKLLPADEGVPQIDEAKKRSYIEAIAENQRKILNSPLSGNTIEAGTITTTLAD